MKKLIACLVWVLMLHIGYAQIPGTPDMSFNPAESSFLGNGPNGAVRTAVQQPDGKFIIGGSFSYYNGVSANRIARINPDGSLDQGFSASFTGSSGFGSILIKTIKLQTDGKIIVGGNFLTVNGISKPYLARLNNNGSIDETFNPGGTGPNGVVNACLVLPNDSIVVAGEFNRYNSSDAKFGVAFLGSNGLNGLTINPADNGLRSISEVLLQPDGKILLCGNTGNIEGGSIGLARLNANRTVDASLAIFRGFITEMALQPDGKILVSGPWAVANGQISPGIQRLMPNGTLDNTFNPGTGFRKNYPDLMNQKGYATELLVQDNGKILAAGTFSTYNNQGVGPLIRINADGTLDQSFILSNEIPIFDPAIFSLGEGICLIEAQNGKLLLGGYLNSTTENRRKNLFLLNSTGSIDRTFNSNRGFTGDVLNTIVQPNGRILAGGNFTAYNDTVARNFTRLMPDGSLDRAFNNQMAINGPVFASALQPDGKILIAGRFTMVQGVRRNSVARLNMDGSLDAGFNMGGAANDSIKAIAVRPDGNIVIAGAFTKVGSTNAARIILLSPNGNPINGFGGKGANHTINDLVAMPDNSVVVGGLFDQFDGKTNAHLVSIGQDNNATILNPLDFQGYINAIEVNNEGELIVGGNFYMTFNGITYRLLVKIRPKNNIDPNPAYISLKPTPFIGEVHNILAQPDGRIIMENDISGPGPFPYRIVERLLASGTSDNSFRPLVLRLSKQQHNSNRLALLSNGNLLAVGDFYTLGNSLNFIAYGGRRGIASIFAYKPIPNDEPCDAINLLPGSAGAAICNNPVTGTLLGASKPSITISPFPVPAVRQTTQYFNDVWYRFTASKSSHFVKISFLLSRISGSPPPIVELFKLNCGATGSGNLTPLIQKEYDPLIPNQLILNAVNLEPDSVYYIRYMNPMALTFFTPEDFNFNICVLTPGNDEPCNAITVTPKTVGDTSSTGATVGTLYPSTFANGTSNGNIGDVWYKFKATSTSHIIRAAGNGFQIKAGIFRGTDCGQLTQIGGPSIAAQVGAPLLLSLDTLKTDSVYFLQISSVTNNVTPEQAGFSFSVLTPLNNTPCTASPIMPGLPADSTTAFTEGSTYFSTFGGDLSCSRQYNPDVWYRFTATANRHTLEVQVRGPNSPAFSINASVYTDTLCASKGYRLKICHESNSIKLPLTGLLIGKSYLIRIASASANSSFKPDFKLRVLTPPINDVSCFAIILTPGPPSQAVTCTQAETGTLYGSATEFESNGFNTFKGDIWYKFIATSSSHLIKVNGDTKSWLVLYEGSNCSALPRFNPFKVQQPLSLSDGSRIFGFGNLTIGQTYFIRLGYSNLSTGISNSQLSLCVLTPLNDTRQTALEITSNSSCNNPIPIDLTVATPDSTNPNAPRDIWYRFKASSKNHKIRVNFQADKFVIKLGSFTSDNSPLQVIDSVAVGNSYNGPKPLTIGSNNLVPGSDYFIVIQQANVSQHEGFNFCLLTGQNDGPCTAQEVLPGAMGDTSCNSPVTGNFSLGSNSGLADCNGLIKTRNELWYHFKATAGRHFIRYSGPSALMVVYDSSDCSTNSFARVFCDSIPGGKGRIQVLNGLIAGQHYYLRMGSENMAGDQAFSFCLLTPPANYNDEPCNAIPITKCDLTTGHVLFATPSIKADCGGGKLHDVWYRFAVPDNGVMSVGASELGFNPTVRFVKLTDCAQPNLGTDIVCQNSPGQAELIDLLNLSPGEEYYMAIGYSDKAAFQSPSSGKFEIRFVSSTNAFVSISSNQNGAICQGTQVTFTATANNVGPNPAFQWLLNGNNIGTNSSILIIDSLKQGDTIRCRLLSDIVCTGPVLSNKIGMQVTPRLAWYLDADNDGFGDAASDSLACTKPVGYVANSTDCNDAEGTMNTTFKFYADADGDGFGIEPLLDVCAQNGTKAPRGYSLLAGDTDDSNGKLNPHAPAAEYFIDTDPGAGNGLPINFSVVNDSIIIEENLTFENLAPGFHTLGIRVLNAGNWSLFEPRSFYVDEPTLPIVSGEYFFDTDPGAGKAAPFSPEIFDDTAKATLTIPSGTLSAGFHYAGFRTLDGAGKWGLTEYRGFYVDSSFTLDEQPIVAVEYYLDTDPGAGKGTVVNVPASDTIELKEQVGTSMLTPGFHFVTVRGQSANGRWGLGEVRGFYVQPAEARPNRISGAEFFLTQDPGTGISNSITIAQPVDTLNSISPLAIPNTVPVGTYLLGLRVKDESGGWSLFETDTVTVTSNATNLSIPFTQICAGLSTDIGFTANGPFNAGNVFTAQLSNGLGDFTSPVNIGSSSTNTSGTITITIPINTPPGLNYRIRIASSSPASASVISGNGFAISGSLTPADANTIQTLSANQVSNLVDANCRMITSLLPNGQLPVSGSVSAKVWVEDNVPLNNGVPYVGRHYEITPSLNGSLVTARVTLYFTQAEFDAYNNHPNTNSFERLPTSPTDAAGKANLLVFKYSGTSSDGSGLPSTYPNDIFVIDPADESIIWNEALQRWEVSFDVTGFSGFIVSTSPSFVHGPTILYTNWIGNISEEWEDAANWSHGVPTASTIAIIPAGRPNYPTVSVSTTVKGVVAYEGTTVIVNDGVVVKVEGR